MFTQKKNNKNGFTLVEVLIVMALLFIMTGLSLANYNRFGREVELENAAYELALTIRQAQFFGINRSEQFGGATNFDNPQPYGIYFNLVNNDEEGITDQKFMMFVDQDNDRRFDESNGTGAGSCISNSSDECINIYEFNRANFIHEICVGTSASDCNDIDGLGTLGNRTMMVSFKRPDPDAAIYIDGVVTPFAYARITLRAPADTISDKSVSIGAAGLISID